jgi:hypothetical protein
MVWYELRERVPLGGKFVLLVFALIMLVVILMVLPFF